MKKVLIRFPNQTEYLECEIDIKGFRPEYETEMETFGWFGECYLAIKKEAVLSPQS